MENEINLIDILKILNRYKYLILLIVIVSMSFTAIKGITTPKLYSATATILPIEGSMAGSNILQSLAEQTFGMGGGGLFGGGGSKLEAIIQSRTLANMVLPGLSLSRNLNGLANKNDAKGEESDMDAILGQLSVKSDRNGIVAITIIHSNPYLAAEIANMYIKKLGDFTAQRALNIAFQILDPATPNIHPINRNIKKNVMFSAGMSLIIGIVFSFVLNYLRELVPKIK